MSSPCLKNNPFMSLWPGSAQSVANSARARITKRYFRTAMTKANKNRFGMWTDALTTGTRAKKTRR
jgi:hypothetical protein